jgi:hypothetical protein
MGDTKILMHADSYLAAGITVATGRNSGTLSWRLPLALQIIPAAILAGFSWTLPEVCLIYLLAGLGLNKTRWCSPLVGLYLLAVTTKRRQFWPNTTVTVMRMPLSSSWNGKNSRRALSSMRPTSAGGITQSSSTPGMLATVPS